MLNILLSAIILSQIAPDELRDERLLRSCAPENVGKSLPDTAITDFLNLRINSDATNIQNEEQVVYNPLDSMNIVAVWRDFRLGYRRVGYGYSFDGGATWHDDLFVGTPYPWDSDPGITVDDSGNFYAVVLALTENFDESGIFVFKSLDGGMNWLGPYEVISGVPNVFEDKELIACDRVPNSPFKGNLYVVWTRFWSTRILVSRSTDGGMTWSEPLQISEDFHSVQWPVPVVGDSGVVYVAWVDLSSYQLKLAKSLDGGQSFTQPLVIQPIRFPYGYIEPQLTVFAYPAMDADISPESPYRGNLYIAYSDENLQGDHDIFFIKSTDGGTTWSDPIRLNDDPITSRTDQFHPWLDVDQEGTITVIFYDRRNDPNNLLMDLYMTQSFDGGETWTPNVRITSVSSDPSAGCKAGLIGEYIGLDVYRGRIIAVWTDTREGTQDVYAGFDTTRMSVREGTGAEPRSRFEVKITPSVAVKKLEIEVKNPPDDFLDYEIYGIDGRVVGNGVLSNRHSSIDISSLPCGIYFFRARWSGGQKVIKFQKIK